MERTLSRWTMTWEVVRKAQLMTPRLTALLSGYYLLTPLNAATDGMAWLLLVHVFSARAGFQPPGSTGADFLGWLPARLMADSSSQLLVVSVLFIIKAALTAAILSLEGTAQAVIRRTLQEHCLASVMHGRWEFLRQGNVGQWVGAVTEEASIFSNYFIMGARTLYALITFMFLALMAIMVNPKLSLIMLALTLPAGLLLRLLYLKHAALSGFFAQGRQRFAGDVTERLSGLFQIKAFGDLAPHLEAASLSQEDCTRTEIKVATMTGLINAFSPLLLPILLVAFSIWTTWQGQSIATQISVLGSVGILGYRAISQLSTLGGSFGNLTSFSGCVAPGRRICM
ncbi:MAG: ABC transporter transmembrane domain-containing protein, partial [Elusimicrobiota bacterium]